MHKTSEAQPTPSPQHGTSTVPANRAQTQRSKSAEQLATGKNWVVKTAQKGSKTKVHQIVNNNNPQSRPSGLPQTDTRTTTALTGMAAGTSAAHVTDSTYSDRPQDVEPISSTPAAAAKQSEGKTVGITMPPIKKKIPRGGTAASQSPKNQSPSSGNNVLASALKQIGTLVTANNTANHTNNSLLRNNLSEVVGYRKEAVDLGERLEEILATTARENIDHMTKCFEKNETSHENSPTAKTL